MALGHPLESGSSRIVVTLINALRDRNLSKGYAGICNGGGGRLRWSWNSSEDGAGFGRSVGAFESCAIALKLQIVPNTNQRGACGMKR